MSRNNITGDALISKAATDKFRDGWDAIWKKQPPYSCVFCGAPSWVDPSDQSPPPDYCHPEDHGTPE